MIVGFFAMFVEPFAMFAGFLAIDAAAFANGIVKLAPPGGIL
jgi:hypothetical protein